jgi:protein-S-isoprenylcysteine O-methyltransferase
MHLCYEGKLSLYCYLSTAVVVVLFTLNDVFLDITSFEWYSRLVAIISLYLFINIIIRKKFQNNDYQVIISSITDAVG